MIFKRRENFNVHMHTNVVEEASESPRRIRNPSMEISLPHSVEQMLLKICTEQQQPPADALARRQLALLGEESALKLLREISRIPIRNISALIQYMAKQVSQSNAICFVFFLYQLL